MGDRSAQLALQIQQAARFAIVGFRPNLNLISGTNQLRGDAKMAGLRAERALEQIVGSHFPANLGKRLGGVVRDNRHLTPFETRESGPPETTDLAAIEAARSAP